MFTLKEKTKLNSVNYPSIPYQNKFFLPQKTNVYGRVVVIQSFQHFYLGQESLQPFYRI